MKDRIKDTDAHPEEEMHRAKYMGKGRSFRALSGHTGLPRSSWGHQPGSSPTLCFRDFMEDPSRRHV